MGTPGFEMTSRRRRSVDAARQAEPPAPAPVEPAPLTVVLTCHTAYIPFLPAAMASIDGQSAQAAAKVLVLDGVKRKPSGIPADWKVIRGKWGSPNPGRNAALATVATEWVVFFDADNAMSDGQLAAYGRAAATADRRVAFVYPDIQYTDAALSPTYFRSMRDFDRWDLRWDNNVDTSGCWRVECLRLVGGFRNDTPNSDDYCVAADLTAQGWTGLHLAGTVTLMREHDCGRRSKPLWALPGFHPSVRWRVQRHAVVTLMSGRLDMLDSWRWWMETADLPPDTTVVVVDNSRDDTFGGWLRERLPYWRFPSLHFVRDKRAPDGDLTAWATKARHVAGLYNRTLADVANFADKVLTLEDDIAPKLDAAWNMYAAFDRCGTPVGVVGAVYENPDRRGCACLSYDRDAWGTSPALSDVPAVVHPVQFIGAGFTWYAGWTLARVLPVGLDTGLYLGWDAQVAKAARGLGYVIMADGRTVVGHDLTGRAPA